MPAIQPEDYNIRTNSSSKGKRRNLSSAVLSVDDSQYLMLLFDFISTLQNPSVCLDNDLRH